jgi:uncharacterized protein
MATRPTPKKSRTSGRGRPRKRSFDNRFRRSSSTPRTGNAGLSSRKKGKSAHPAMLIAALVAVVTLVGLIYWGKSSEPAPVQRSAAATRDQGNSPEKAFDHRKSPGPGTAALPRTGENNNRHQSAAPVEKRITELHELTTPRHVPNSNTQETPTGNHYASRAPEHNSSEPPKPPPPKPPTPPLTPPIARVAIVIDDFGADLNIAKRFIELPIPITLSILPYQRYSREIAELAHAHQRQVILHLPMEPKGYPKVNPGKGALLVSMSGSNIQKSVSAALESGPYFTGINNHMGSRFTENAVLMKTVLEEAQKRGLYFIDSYTSPRSVASTVAQQVHIPFRRRDIFLDNNQSEDAIRAQIRQVIRRARIQGSALAIGHPHESTLRALSQEAEGFEREEIAVVPAGELIPGF